MSRKRSGAPPLGLQEQHWGALPWTQRIECPQPIEVFDEIDVEPELMPGEELNFHEDR